ncbi:hypothetical protein AYO20_09470 [Fonsecaea nubica]|uniref:Uncharacterized protein n=1 Tax=Fonsecaea nubica TaxID=856822 RepID=A0A178CH33_9EURO|nr:hypothetical protein AYO20_09470 [Fonsecaea nubica]OAL28353.1 hypothetical protein AYO20_09470 [Fonsecaea nubica]
MAEPSSEDPKLELTDELRQQFRKLVEDEWAWETPFERSDYDRDDDDDDSETCKTEELSPYEIAEKSWPKSKFALFTDWDENPDEPYSTKFLANESTAQFKALRLTPTDFCELIKSLDIWDPKQVRDLRTKTNLKCYNMPLTKAGKPEIPFPLFKYGRMYFYIDLRPYVEPGGPLVPRRIRKPKGKTSSNPCWVEYDPPIIIPPHLRSSGDTEYSSNLRYGLAIGTIAASMDDDIDRNDSRASKVPFDVLLHPADKSFWIVFKNFAVLPYFLEQSHSEEGPQAIRKTHRGSLLWDWCEAVQPVAVWRMSFSDVQRIAQRRSYSGGYISKVNPEVDGDEKDSPRPQVIVDARDPFWNS